MTDRYTVDNAKAAHLAFTSLVLALHKNGVLPLSAVVTELGNQIDAQATKKADRSINEHANLYYETLLMLEARIGPDFRKSAD